jgi:GntR family transcriptional repressor for pyruvate dehydrogenase complex
MDKIDYSVRKTNLYEQIAGKLEQAILRSGKKVEKLPSEQELCKRFGVSRTVIREALKVLKERGLIQPRNGEGSYVVSPKTDTVSEALDRIIQINNISNDDLHSMRLLLETEGARLAALNALPGDLEKLEGILGRMEDLSLPLDERIRLDAEFHITMVQAGKNELLGIFTEVMTMLLKDYMIKGLFGPPGINKTLAQHRKILDALRREDPGEAEKALRDHLSAARENVGKYERGRRPQAVPRKRP